MLVHDVATHVFSVEMAVWLEQMQSHPLLELQAAPSQVSKQSFHYKHHQDSFLFRRSRRRREELTLQEGSHANADAEKRAAANTMDFMLTTEA